MIIDGPVYKQWLDEDMRWIITDEERAAFKQLTNDMERDNFIEGFWARRDPTPDTHENEFKDEHYRRMLYVNERFAASIPGWKTDRGRIYIVYGPPDEIKRGAEGPPGTTYAGYPYEMWRYRYMEGVGVDVEITFADTCRCGEYHMTLDATEKETLLWISGSLPNAFEATSSSNTHQYIAAYISPTVVPQTRFKDLEEVVARHLSFKQFPFAVRTDAVRITSITHLVPLTIGIRNADLTFKQENGEESAEINIFGRLITLTGHVAETFEDAVRVAIPAEQFAHKRQETTLYWKALRLREGIYRLDLAVRDVNGDRTSTSVRALRTWSGDMAELAPHALTASSLILADRMEPLPENGHYAAPSEFTIGLTNLRPRIANPEVEQQPAAKKRKKKETRSGPADWGERAAAVFARTEQLNVWMQAYNLGVGSRTYKPDAAVEYAITDLSTNRVVAQAVESAAELDHAGQQITMKKSWQLAGFAPGTYEVTIRVTDKLTKQSVQRAARFAVE